MRKAFDVLRDFGLPVFLLPGNHDPHTPDSLYRSELWRQECPDNVHVLTSIDPVEVRAGVHLLPCPQLERQGFDDPSAHLTSDFGPQEGFRIGVAHGGIREILEALGDAEYQLTTAIAQDAASRGALDYLALGDWHGLLRVGERTWYSGTPETTRFKEKQPGHVLVVEIDQPGAVPTITPAEVQTLRWVVLSGEINAEDDVQAILARLEELPDKADTLVELHLAGTVDVELRTRIDTDLLDRARDRFRWIRPRTDQLYTIVGDEDLDEIAREGWVADVVTALRGENTDETTRALRILYRLHKEVTS